MGESVFAKVAAAGVLGGAAHAPEKQLSLLALFVALEILREGDLEQRGARQDDWREAGKEPDIRRMFFEPRAADRGFGLASCGEKCKHAWAKKGSAG